MEGDATGFVSGVRSCFEGLRDPRGPASCEPLLFDIVSISMCRSRCVDLDVSISILTVACRADDGTDLETFGNKRRERLATFEPARNFRAAFRRRTRFVACSDCWIGRSSRPVCCHGRRRCTRPAAASCSPSTVRRCDIRRGRDRVRKRPGLEMRHLVTAWSSDNGLTWAQAACDDKSNEITAIPELWKLLSLKGCTVTIDRHRRNAVVGLPTGDRPANPRAEGA